MIYDILATFRKILNVLCSQWSDRNIMKIMGIYLSSFATGLCSNLSVYWQVSCHQNMNEEESWVKMAQIMVRGTAQS